MFMTVSARSRLSLASAAIAAVLAGPACVDIIGADVARVVDRQEKRVSTKGPPDVDGSTFDGSIEIRPWDRSEVLVVVAKRAPGKPESDTHERETAPTGRS